MIMPTPKAPDLSGCLTFIVGLAAGVAAVAQALTGDWVAATWALATAYLCLRQGWHERELAELRDTSRRTR
ncbi:hypothetical protein OHA25_08605 [Nonomuraea sp. NBC_00507]|uniref:hypothetical protein n=1 Tax=Nonomuraea sp. NBC_00507 TaxID=2976002 RepID=UPI002E18AE88